MDLFGNKKPVQIEVGEWWFNGRIIQRHEHSKLPTWVSHSEESHSGDPLTCLTTVHTSLKNATQYAMENPTKDPKNFPEDYIGMGTVKSTRKEHIKTPEEALLYLADCTLATVAEMACKKSKSKSEFERQMGIAQSAVDWIKRFNIRIPVDSRVYHVLATTDQLVATWAALKNCT